MCRSVPLTHIYNKCDMLHYIAIQLEFNFMVLSKVILFTCFQFGNFESRQFEREIKCTRHKVFNENHLATSKCN